MTPTPSIAVLLRLVLLLCAGFAASVPAAAASCDTGAAPPKPRQVKWHPGHYVTLPFRPGRDAAYLDEVLLEMDKYTALRGVQKRYTWAELEPSKDRYDFGPIERDLARLAAKNKRLVVLLQVKAFSDSMDAVPDYLDGAEYDGGSFELDIRADGGFRKQARSGSNLKLWQPKVRERLVALACAMGQKLNAHPNLEAVALTETAIGQPRQALTAAQLDGFFDGLVAVHRAWRTAFPNTVTLQFVNYPRSHIGPLVQSMTAFGTGLGGPDTFLDDPGLHGGAYKLYPGLAGIVPLAPSIQPENYAARRHRGPRQPPAPQELYDFTRQQLRANYLFWTRRLTPTEQPYFEVLKLFKSPGFPTDAAGGLAAACPKAFESCVE